MSESEFEVEFERQTTGNTTFNYEKFYNLPTLNGEKVKGEIGPMIQEMIDTHNKTEEAHENIRKLITDSTKVITDDQIDAITEEG